jgi:DNA-binding CsgD family transcriptional regulator
LESNDPTYLDELYYRIPADILHVNDNETLALKYVDPVTLGIMGITLEELPEKGGEILGRRVRPTNYEHNIPIVLDYVTRKNPHEICVVFQELNIGNIEKEEFEWYVTFMKLSEKAEGIFAMDFKIDFLERYQKKFLKIIEWDQFLHQNMESFQSLTEREIEILTKVALGISSQEMADDLAISKLTVDTHRKNLMSKLEIKRFPDLVKFAEAFDLV